ncbi:MAG TPA: peptidoglycan-binding domain-containing protein, partial [Steroidobacteraceae bacterium]|nr:peptidoglycan-binding domain-containing protein [Steroidobacteraceae bacterium]
AGTSDPGPASDVYDASLTSLVRQFQRNHRLTVDGIAGVKTQVALAGALAGAGPPRPGGANGNAPGNPLLTAARE